MLSGCSGLQGGVRETPKVIQRSVPVLGAIVDADIHPTRRARPGPVPASRVVPASVEKLDPDAPPFTQPTAERGPSDHQRVLDRASSRWVVWMLSHRGASGFRVLGPGENHEKGEEALETPQAGRSQRTADRRHVIRGESSRNDAESQALYAATLELLRPLNAACAFHAKHKRHLRAKKNHPHLGKPHYASFLARPRFRVQRGRKPDDAASARRGQRASQGAPAPYLLYPPRVLTTLPETFSRYLRQ